MFEQVLEQIRALLLSGELEPGDRLLTERDFAETLQVSRTSVREAMRILEVLDLIQAKPGGGTVLKEPRLSVALSSILTFLIPPRSSLKELLDARVILEPGIAKVAALVRTEEDLVLLREYVNIMNTTTKDEIERLSDATYQFHSTLAHITGNQPIITLQEVLEAILKEHVFHCRELLAIAEVDVGHITLNQGYSEILKGIELGEAELAAKATQTMLQELVQSLQM